MSSINEPVLVLNKVWMPIRVIPAIRALTLVFAGKASAIDTTTNADGDINWGAYNWDLWAERDSEGAEHVVTTTKAIIKVPEIIVLSKYNKVFRKQVRLTKRNIKLRDGNRCQYTGKKMKDSEADVDHVIPRAHGGQNTWDNMVFCSKEVNRMKADRTPEQAGLKLIKRPAKPHADKFLVDPRIKHPESWDKFLKVKS